MAKTEVKAKTGEARRRGKIVLKASYDPESGEWSVEGDPPAGRPPVAVAAQVSAAHHHEKILRLRAAAVLDAVDEVRRHRDVLYRLADLVSSAAMEDRELTRRPLEQVSTLTHQRLRDVRVYNCHGIARTNLAEIAEELSDRVGYFKTDYDGAVALLGFAAVQQLLAGVHLAYLGGPEKFVPAWRTFLALVEKAGVPLTFPH